MDVSGRQEKNQHIKVFVRVKPLSNHEKAKNTLEVSSSKELLVRERPLDKNSRKFTFDKVFGPKSDQVDVYRTVVNPLVSEVLAGYNCTVFAYGQTGTGKTFTMEGEKSSNTSLLWHEDPLIGIIPRALSHLFDELRMFQAEYSVKVSFLELYNEELLDLLSPVDDSSKIKLYEDATKKGSVIIHGLQEVTVRSKNEVYGIMEKGSLKRQTAATMLNAHSSRSHTIFTITVHIKENSVEGDELIKVGKLNLVDLAGSENIGRSGATDKRAREAGNINQSLLTLGRVITSLVERAPHVPYRESKLTRLLQESLGGRTKTSIIATVSAHSSNMEETLSTLEYAHRAKNIQNKPEVNQKLAKKALIKEYTEEIDRLRRDLMATRERTGIYLAEENYTDMLNQIEMQKTEMAELLGSVKNLKECLEEKEQLNAELSQSLAEYNHQLNTAQLELQKTKGELQETITERNEKEHLVEQHVTTEHSLMEQARSLLAAVDGSTTDNHNLHSSLEKRRLLEKGNEDTCRSFHDKTKQDLDALKLDIDKLLQGEEHFKESLNKKLDGSYQEMKTWSSVAEQRVSTILNAQIQLQLLLDQEVAKLRPNIELVERCRRTADEEQENQENLLGKTSDFLQKQMLEHRAELSRHQETIDDVREEVAAMLSDHKKVIDGLAAATAETFSKLKVTVLDKLSELQRDSEQDTNAIRCVRSAKDSFVEAVQQTMQQFFSLVTSSAAEIESNCEGLGQRNLVRKEKMKELEDDLQNAELCNESRFTSTTENCSRQGDSRLDNLRAKMSGVEMELQENEKSEAESVRQVVDEIASQRETGKVQSQFVRENLATVVASLTAIEENHMEHSKTLAKELESSSGALRELRTDPVTFMEVVKEEYSTDAETHCRSAQSACLSTRNNVELLQDKLAKFVEEDLQVYVASGNTPERRELAYPRTFKPTSPHERILQRFRAKIQEEEVRANSTTNPISGSEEDSSPEVDGAGSRLGASSSTSDIHKSSSVGLPTSVSAPDIMLIEEKENSNAKEEFVSTTKSRGTRKPRKILQDHN